MTASVRTFPVPILVMAAFVALGFLLAWSTEPLLERFGLPIALLIIASVPVVGLTIRQGGRSFAALKKNFAWWHALWFLMFLSWLVFRQRDSYDIKESPVDFWALYRILLVAVVASVLMKRQLLHQSEWLGSLFRGLPGALALYAIVSLLSTIWSVYPAWTFYKSLEYLVDVALIVAVIESVKSHQEYKTFLDLTWVMLSLHLIAVWIGALIWPQDAFVISHGLISWRISGVMPALDQNTVGEFASVLAVVALCRLPFRIYGKCNRSFYALVLIGSLITLILSQTRAALAGFALAFILLLLFTSRRRMALAILVSIILMLLFTNSGELTWTFFLRGHTQDFANVSGRREPWEWAWRLFKAQPIAGYGAYSGRFVVLEHAEPTWQSLLNSYMEILIGTGFWGLLPVLVALIGSWKQMIRGLRSQSSPDVRQLALEGLGVLAIVTVRSFSTSHLIWHPALDFLPVVGCAEFLRRRWQHRTAMATINRSPFGVERPGGFGMEGV